MFRTVWSKTLRDYRIATLVLGPGLSFLLLLIFDIYGTQLINPNEQATLAQLVQQFRAFGDPVAINTAAGFATWRVMDLIFPVLLSIWAILAGARLVRGEEERGSMDVLLSTPQPRVRILIEKIAAMVTVLVVIGLLVGLGGVLGEASANTSTDVLRALLAGVNLSLIAFFFGMLATLLSQVMPGRVAAAGWTTGILVVSFLFDATGRIAENTAWIQRLSPLYYYNLNKPLIPTSEANFGAVALLLALCAVFVAASLFLFARRDVRGVALLSLKRGASRIQATTDMKAFERAQRDISCRTVGLRALGAQAFPLFWWLVGIAGYAAWITLLIPSLEAPFRQILTGSPIFEKLLSGQDIGTNAGFLATVVFQFVPVLVVLFALTQALTWPTDLDNGRMELVLSTPKPRYRIVLERYGAVFVAAVAASLVTWLSVLVGARIANFSVDVGNVAAASFGTLPLELIVASLVYLMAERLRSGAILGIVALFIAVSFFSELLRTLLKLPDWVMSLSIFHQYGSPATDGLQWGSFLGMLVVAMVVLALGVIQFTRVNVERGA